VTNVTRHVERKQCGPDGIVQQGILVLFLGGAAVYRCDKVSCQEPALAAEVTRPRGTSKFDKIKLQNEKEARKRSLDN
jgi:hypothetical protein